MPSALYTALRPVPLAWESAWSTNASKFRGPPGKPVAPQAHCDREARALIVDEHAQGRHFAVKELGGFQGTGLSVSGNTITNSLPPNLATMSPPAPRRVGTPHRRVA